MPDRVLGILGGMGPEATVDFLREVIRLTPAQKDQDHIPVLVVSDPRIPERTAAILHGGEDPAPHLVRAARTLETAGAGALAMPCNTAHHFIQRIQQEIGIPILNMIEETYESVRRQVGEAAAVGLLATKGTILSRIYQDVFARHGLRIVIPEAHDQDRIQESVFMVKSGSYRAERQGTFEAIGSKLMAAGATTVVLGCTEIPLEFDVVRVDYPVINATRVLAQVAVDWALGKRP